jgi:hypothetical protein
MKTFFVKALLVGFVFVSCNKQHLQPQLGETQFTDLSAEKYTLAAGSTTKVTATVANDCPSVSYNWSLSSGSVNGTAKEVTFTAPSSTGQVTVTCTVTHPGRDPKTKTITITVQ